jgi:glutamate synthase domain-containing protein 2
VQALQELGMHRKVQLIVSGGIRTGADVAKALALGADAVAIGTAALIALGDNHPRTTPSTAKLGTPPATSTTGRTAATRPASPPRTRNSPPASTRSKAAAGSPTTSAC